MKRSAKKYTYGVILSLILLILCHIEPSLAVSITPSRGEVFVGPNEKYTGEYIVGNTEDKAIRVKVFPEKWLLKEGRDATSWIDVWPEEIVIPAHSSKKINYSVKPPAKVEGEYTTSLVFRSLSAEMLGETMEVVSQIRLGMCVVIKGTEIIKGEISKVEILNIDPLKVSVKVKNNGNIHIRPKGKVEIVRLEKSNAGVLEKKITELLLNPIDGSIYSESEGDIGPKSDEVKLEPGDYKAKVRVEFTSEFILKKEIEFTVPVKQKM